MANTEFIAAKDLPTTEAEEVDVLCVEGGELKRKPGASLGGGGSEPDMVIGLVDNPYFSTNITADNFEILHGIVSEVYEKVVAGTPVTVVLIGGCCQGSGYACKACLTPTQIIANTDNERLALDFIANSGTSFAYKSLCHIAVVFNRSGDIYDVTGASVS